MRTRFAALPLAVAVAVAVILFAGCGDGGTANEGVQGGDEAAGRTAGGEPAKEGQKPNGSGGGESHPVREPEGLSPTPRAPLPNEGEKRPAPDVPTTKGGDNSIQEYGLEGPSEDRVGAARTLQAYLTAQTAGRWGRACSYLSAATKEELERLVGQAKTKDEEPKPEGCAEIMRALGGSASGSASRKAADIRVRSMRVAGDQAFAVYEDSEGRSFAIAMDREGDSWFVGDISGNSLALGSGLP